MRCDELLELYEFNQWANARVLGVAGQLEPGAFTKDMGSSFASVRDTLVHIMSAEWVWLSRWKGTSPSAMPDEWKTMSLAEIRQTWAGIEAEQHAYVRSLTGAELDVEIRYRNLAGVDLAENLGRLLRHVVNHSSYHRGQVMTLVRQLGGKPVSTDLVLFHRERGVHA